MLLLVAAFLLCACAQQDYAARAKAQDELVKLAAPQLPPASGFARGAGPQGPTGGAIVD